MTAPLLSLENLTVRRAGSEVVSGANLTVSPGECVGLLGPNGAGKTTLLRAALGLLDHSGHSSLAALPAKDRARAAAWLPQSRDIAWPVSVERLVALGRLPHLPGGRRASDEDTAAIDAAIGRMNLGPMRHRPATELSGGEQARVLIARALAQDAPLLVADEPTAGLDPAAQIAAAQVFADLAAEPGKAVIVSLHDLGLAARHCTRLVLMHQGRIHANGPPAEVLTEANLRDVFGITAHIATASDGGAIFQPTGLTRTTQGGPQ